MSESEHLGKALHHLQEAMLTTGGDTPSKSIKEKTDSAVGIVDKIKDNIAYILGLPAAITGAFGFLWESSAEEAALQDQVAQLEEAVAELQVGNDLLGGGTKNFSLDPSTTSGSITLILIAGGVMLFIALLYIYQKRRRR
tara:strand:+ start:3408 stop:3827 length:420 start_codon:yes stop_codon:yes gene_type:complete